MPAIKKRPAHADLFVYQSTPQQSDDWPLVLAPASPAVTLVLPVLSGMFEVLFVCRLGAQLARAVGGHIVGGLWRMCRTWVDLIQRITRLVLRIAAAAALSKGARRQSK